MPASSNRRRWILAILLATVVPALAIHASCVAVLGTGTWGAGIEEKTPSIQPAGANALVEAYLAAFRSEVRKDDMFDLPEELVDRIPGRIVWSDTLGSADMRVIQSYEGENWTRRQRIFVMRPGDGGTGEQTFPAGTVVERPSLARMDGKTVLIWCRWQSWFLPPTVRLGRYVRSWFDPELRPEYTLHVRDLVTGLDRYAGPGHTLLVAPDGNRAVFLRSGSMAAGFYSVHLWDFLEDHVETLLSLRESDPGSGRSFEYRWAADSQALHLTGSTAGFPRRGGTWRELDLVYLVEQGSWYEVAASGSGRHAPGP